MQCFEYLISVFPLICLRIALAADCVPPVVDLLFIIDGTVNVGALNFEKIKDFAASYSRTMDIGVRASRVALAQFTPQAKPELYLVNSIDLNTVVKTINAIQYTPCVGCSNSASINTIAQFAMNVVSGNREWVPDALVIVHSDLYRPAEVYPNETLMQPVSPIHAFDINVGSIQETQVNYPYAATTVKLSAKDFSSLPDLMTPLCESMVTYVGGSNVTTGSFGSCTIILILVIITAIILLLMFGYIIYKYKQENDMLKARADGADFQDLNQWATNRTGQQERDRLDRIPNPEADVYASSVEAGAIGGRVVNTKVINGRLYNDRYGDGAVISDGYNDRGAAGGGGAGGSQRPQGTMVNGKLYYDRNPDGTVINKNLYNDRGAGGAGGSQRQQGTVISGSAEERIVGRVVNGVVGNVMVKKPRGNNDKPNNGSAEGRIVDRVVNGVVNGVLGRNKGKPLTYDDTNSDDVELGHDPNYQQRDHNGRLIDEHDRHRLENAANNLLLAEASTHAGTSTILGDGNTLRSTDPEDNGNSGDRSPRKARVGDDGAENSPGKQRKSVVSPLNLGQNDSNENTLTHGKHYKDGDDVDHPNSVKEDTSSETGTDSEAELEKEYSELERRQKARNKSHLPRDHPARKLAPVDVLLVVDNSGSIGMMNYEKVKEFLEALLDGVDISPGRSRVAMVLYSNEPKLHFSFDKYYSNKAVRAAVKRMPYQGSSTFLAKALSFAAGVLAQEQNMKHIKKRKHKYLPTPRHDRLQVMIVASDGYSEDNFEKVSGIFHDKLRVKVGAVAVRSFHKERLLPITRFDGSIFLLDQREAMSNWLWKQQRLWQENFMQYVEKEKTAMENTYRSLMDDSPKKTK